MKKLSCLIVLLAVVALPSVSHAQGWTGNINAFIGKKTLDKGDWEPVEDQTEFGISTDFRKTEWLVNIALALLRSKGEGSDTLSGIPVDFDGNITELNAGVSKIWEQFSSIRPYIGGGLTLVSAKFKANAENIDFSESYDDTGFGLWISCGVYWTFAGSYNVGIDLRYSKAEVTLNGTDFDAGGGHAGLILGYHW